MSAFRFDRKYRDRFEIVASILEAAREGYVTKFTIARYTKTNYEQLSRYLQVLVKMRFIEAYVVDGNVFYKTSVEGNNFLKHYSVLLDLISRLQEISGGAAITRVHKVQFAKQTISQKLSRWR